MKKNTLKKKYSKKYTKRKNNKKKSVKKGGAVITATSVLEQYEIDNFKKFLQNPPLDATDVWYGSEKNIDEFLIQKSNSSNPEIKRENDKEIRIACFTNFYRMKIYEIIRKLDEYLGKYGDVVISGGDGLNINLSSVDRLISPDIDVKVIINTEGYNIIDNYETGEKSNWLNLYRKVVIMTEYFIDWIICCLNYSEKTFNDLLSKSELLNIPDPKKIINPQEIRGLFYKYVKSNEPNYIFSINEENFVKDTTGRDYSFFNKYLQHFHEETREFETSGYPWSRRTSDMRAGNSVTPFTLMNVKLIAIDLRYKGSYSYFGSLAGVLDIVVAVPGHIGHNEMNKFEIDQMDYSSFKGYGLTTQLKLPGSNIVGDCYSINLNYYIYEMIKMVTYGLRTKNGKAYKDMKRFKTLLYLGKNFPEETTKNLTEGGKLTIDNENFPKHLKEDSEKLLKDIKNYIPIPKEDFDDFFQVINELEKENLEILDSIEEMLNPDPNFFDKKSELLEGQSDNILDFEPPNYEKKGGGSTDWKNYNSNTLGKTLDCLNIYDFFKNLEKHIGIPFDEDKIIININNSKGNPLSTKGNYTIITLNQHDKIYLDTIPIPENPSYKKNSSKIKLTLEDNYEDGDILNGKRINYETLTSAVDASTITYDLLTKPPYTCYSQVGAVNMTVINSKNNMSKFNTSRIFLTKSSGVIFYNLIFTIVYLLKQFPQFIVHLAQFRHFEDQLDPDDISVVNNIEKEKVICAAYIYSSIIKGFDSSKLQKMKVRFDIQPYNLLEKSLDNFILLLEKFII